MPDVNSEILDQAQPKKENKDSYVQRLREAQEQLCKGLIASNFDFKKWLLEFNTYIKNYDRFFILPFPILSFQSLMIKKFLQLLKI